MRTMTSAFLLTLQFECALTIFLTVARGYSFCPGMVVFEGLERSGEVEGKMHQQPQWLLVWSELVSVVCVMTPRCLVC